MSRSNILNDILVKTCIPFVFTGFEKIAELLIDHGAKINVVDNEENCALVFAAKKGKTSFDCFSYVIAYFLFRLREGS